MKICKKILFIFIIFILNISFVFADGKKNLVNIYLFHSDTCPHCKEEIKFLNDIQKDYDNIKIYMYEISDSYNLELMDEVAKLYDTKASGTPFTIIGDKYFLGFSYEASHERFIASIDYYSNNAYTDRTGEYIGNIELPIYEVIPQVEKPEEEKISVDDYIEKVTDRKINILGKTINLKNMALPVVALVIGLVDGFNPCAMWVLLFLISMLIGMRDKKKMIILGFTFLLTSALIYLLFMLAWLNAATFLLTIKWVRLLIGLVAIVGGYINLRSYIKHRKDDGCNVIDDKKRNRIFDKIKKFTHERNFFLAMLGVITLAISVNVVELACSAGLPVMFIQILSMNHLSLFYEVLYIAIYMFFFLVDDLIVFIIAVSTMELTGFSTKYGKAAKLIGGILLLLIGILMILKPEWLMFNF